MNNYDALYKSFKKVEEDRKKKNFNTLMNCLEKELIEDLNEAYANGETDRYNTLINNIKSQFNARIYRNGYGNHKIKFNKF